MRQRTDPAHEVVGEQFTARGAWRGFPRDRRGGRRIRNGIEERGDRRHGGHSVGDSMVDPHEGSHLSPGESRQGPHLPQGPQWIQGRPTQLLRRVQQVRFPNRGFKVTFPHVLGDIEVGASTQSGAPSPRLGAMSCRNRGTRCSRLWIASRTASIRKRSVSSKRGPPSRMASAPISGLCSARTEHQLVQCSQPVDNGVHRLTVIRDRSGAKVRPRQSCRHPLAAPATPSGSPHSAEDSERSEPLGEPRASNTRI